MKKVENSSANPHQELFLSFSFFSSFLNPKFFFFILFPIVPKTAHLRKIYGFPCFQFLY